MSRSMSDRDPAVEAAQRAWESEGWGGPGRPLASGMSEASLAEAAALEALAPIRSRIEILDATQESFQGDSLDYHDLAQSAIEDIRELIYTSEELK